MGLVLPAVAPRKVIRPPAFAGGDPNAMTCHECRGKPNAICEKCRTVICKNHRCACTKDTDIDLHGTGSKAWDREAMRRYAAWKGE